MSRMSFLLHAELGVVDVVKIRARLRQTLAVASPSFRDAQTRKRKRACCPSSSHPLSLPLHALPDMVFSLALQKLLKVFDDVLVQALPLLQPLRWLWVEIDDLNFRRDSRRSL